MSFICGLATAGQRFPEKEDFIAAASRMMRNILVDYARDRNAAKRGRGTLVPSPEIRIEFSNGDFLFGAQRRTFQRELRVLGRLDHPNIARLIDWGTIPGGLLYLVIEFVDGPNIATYCAQNHLGLTERLAVFQQIVLGRTCTSQFGGACAISSHPNSRG